MKPFLLLILLQISLFSSETVYCIHGFMRKPSSMKKMAKSFEKRDYAVVNWGYPSRQKTVEEHTDALVKDLQVTAQTHPGEPIHFVTHSLGGIILRAAHNHPDCPDEAKKGRAVLLAPPNQGARFGKFLGKMGLFRKILGDKAGSQILLNKNFSNVGEFPEEKEVLVISGTCGFNPIVREKNDGKVGVKESCLNTPHKHMTHLSGHSWIMYSSTIVQNAIFFISDKNNNKEP